MSSSFYRSFNNAFFICVALTVSLPVAPTARAGIISLDSGNTKASNIPGLVHHSTFNFAVYDRLNGASSSGDVYGTGSANFDSSAIAGDARAFDKTARYLYVYQLVNSPESIKATIGFFPGGDGKNRFAGVTSIARWNLTLSDNGGLVSTTNDFGADGVAFSPNAPANLGVTTPGIASPAASPTLTAPSSLSVTSDSFGATFGVNIPAGGISQLFGCTTNASPEIVSFTGANATFATGTIVEPVPEPSFIVSIVPVLLLWRRHRSGSKQTGIAHRIP